MIIINNPRFVTPYYQLYAAFGPGKLGKNDNNNYNYKAKLSLPVKSCGCTIWYGTNTPGGIVTLNHELHQ